MPPKDETLAEMQARIARYVKTLRAIVDDYTPSSDTPQVTTPDRRLVRSTPLEGLLAAANFIDSVPGIGGTLADRDLLMRTIDRWPLHEDLLLQAKVLVRLIEDEVVRDRLEAVHYARGIYRVGKSYVTAPPTKRLQHYLHSMQQHLGRKKRRRAATAEDEPAE